MPKKINYKEELKSLRKAPEHSLRPLTTRVSVACLRNLYERCDRDGLDLSTLVRRLLEERGEQAPGAMPAVATVTLRLPEEIQDLADRACAGLAVDLPPLLQLVVTEALPAWVLRGGKALQQRQQARDSLENKPTPEMAAWITYRRLASPQHAASLDHIRGLMEEGAVRLELDSEALLYVVIPEATVAQESAAVSAEGKAFKDLAAAGVLVPDEAEDGVRTRWKLDPQALLATASGGGTSTSTGRQRKSI